MKSLRYIIRESIQLAENVQQADKIYFNTRLLSPEVKKYILQITGGDAYTKLVTDIYYAEQQQQQRLGKWALAHISDGEEEEAPEGHIASENDVMRLEDWKRVKEMYLQLKSYNKNVFPIKGLNINGVVDIWELIRALKERGSILKFIEQLPSIARRNMKNDFRQERNSNELQTYRAELESFLNAYSLLGNRDEKLRKAIEKKMFKSNVTLNDLLDFTDEKENLLGGAKFTRNTIKKLVRENDYNMEIVYDKGNIMVVDVTSPEAIKEIGCNSLWCFTYGKGFQVAYSQWSTYSTNDHVYVIIDFSEPSDSPQFMHVLIKPLDYKSDVKADEENDSKLFNMANDDVAGALWSIDHMIGLKDAPYIFTFGEPVDVEGPTSKWPYEDPNQTKLDLKEIRKLIRQQLSESKFLDKIKDFIAYDGEMHTHFKTRKIEDWPVVPSSDDYGDDEKGTLDLENNEFHSIDDKNLTLVTGGDWQDPWIVNIGLKKDKLAVIDYKKAEKGERKKMSKDRMKTQDMLEKIYEDDPIHNDIKSYFDLVKKHLKEYSPWNNSYGNEDYKNEIVEGPKINEEKDGIYVIWNLGGHDKYVAEENRFDAEPHEKFMERKFTEWAEKKVWCGKKKEFKIDNENYKIKLSVESLGNDNVKFEIKVN